MRVRFPGAQGALALRTGGAVELVGKRVHLCMGRQEIQRCIRQTLPFFFFFFFLESIIVRLGVQNPM